MAFLCCLKHQQGAFNRYNKLISGEVISVAKYGNIGVGFGESNFFFAAFLGFYSVG